MRPLDGLGVSRGDGAMLSPLARDRSVLRHQLPRGTARRVLAQGRPFAGLLVVFALAVLGGSATTVLPMLLFQHIIDDGVLAGDAGTVVRLALIVAALALLGAGLALLERWCSAQVGEGLIHRAALPALRPRQPHAAGVLHPLQHRAAGLPGGR